MTKLLCMAATAGTIVSDPETEERMTMPPELRPLGTALGTEALGVDL